MKKKRKKLKKKIQKKALKKKRLITSRKIERPKGQGLLQPFVRVFSNFRKQQKIDSPPPASIAT